MQREFTKVRVPPPHEYIHMEAARIACFGSLSGAFSGIEQQPFDSRIHALAPFAVEDIPHANCTVLAETGDNFFRDWTQWILVHSVSSQTNSLEVFVNGHFAATAPRGTTSATTESEGRTGASARPPSAA